MVGDGLVNGGAADLDHLEPGRGLQHPMADLRRLQHAIAGLEQEGLALILIDEARPALAAIDHLEADLVEMDVVGHRPAFGDADMGGDEAPAEAARNQIAILHAGTPLAPGRTAGHAGERRIPAAPSGSSMGGSASTSSILVPSGAIISLGMPAGSDCSVAEQAKDQRAFAFATRSRLQAQGDAMS